MALASVVEGHQHLIAVYIYYDEVEWIRVGEEIDVYSGRFTLFRFCPECGAENVSEDLEA